MANLLLIGLFVVGMAIGCFLRWWMWLLLWIIGTVVALQLIAGRSSACKFGDEVCVLEWVNVLFPAFSGLAGLIVGLAVRKFAQERQQLETPDAES